MPVSEVRWGAIDTVPAGEFEDALGKTFRIAESVEIGKERCLSLGRSPTPMILTQTRVRELLPALQTFVETGKLLPERRRLDGKVALERDAKLRSIVRAAVAQVVHDTLGGEGLVHLNEHIKNSDEDQVVRDELEGLLRLITPSK